MNPFFLSYLVFLSFCFAVVLSYTLLRFRTSPILYVIGGGVLGHMSLVAGHNASSVPKALAVLWPVDLSFYFVLATAITSYLFLAVAYLVTMKRTAEVPSVGFALYNLGYGYSVASAVFSAPAYSEAAPWLLLGGVAALGICQAYVIRVWEAVVKRRTSAWYVGMLGFGAGIVLYFILPTLQTDLYSRMVVAYVYAGAAPALIYTMLRINLYAAGALGGFNFKFFAGLLGGVMTYAVAEVLVMLYSPYVHSLLHL